VASLFVGLITVDRPLSCIAKEVPLPVLALLILSSENERLSGPGFSIRSYNTKPQPPLSNSMKETLKRLRMMDNRSQADEPIDRNFRRAFSELHRLKDKLSLPDSVLEQAAYIYRKALDKKLVRGRSISAMIGSALYAACREVETPRTLKEIAETSNIKKGDLAHCYRLLVKELDLKMPVVDSVQNVARIASKIGLSEKTKRYAIEILRKAEENKTSSGKNPMGLAAAALYLSCVKNRENKTQLDLAGAANITEVTIRNRCKGLREMLKN